MSPPTLDEAFGTLIFSFFPPYLCILWRAADHKTESSPVEPYTTGFWELPLFVTANV